MRLKLEIEVEVNQAGVMDFNLENICTSESASDAIEEQFTDGGNLAAIGSDLSLVKELISWRFEEIDS